MSVTTLNRPNGNGNKVEVYTTDTDMADVLLQKRKTVDAYTFLKTYMDAYHRGLDPITKKSTATLEQVANELGLTIDTAYQKMRNIKIKLKKEKGIDIPILTTKKKTPRKKTVRLNVDELAALVAGQHLAELD